jgi:hypothetical protein
VPRSHSCERLPGFRGLANQTIQLVGDFREILLDPQAEFLHSIRNCPLESGFGTV